MDAEYLSGVLAGARRRHQVPGAQLALHRDGVTVCVESGHQRHGDAAPVTRESSFPYGSVTKAFTATVVMQLAGDGDIELDEPLGACLPDLAGAPNGIDRLVTPRHLLSHTSGLPGDFDADGPADGAAGSFRRHALAARDLELVQPPGSGFSYSNVGFVLAGLLIEDVTGMTWWDAVESVLLRPLDIEPAFCVDPRIPPGRRATVTAHSVSAALNRTVPVEPLFPTFDGPAGGLAGSAADLVAFGRMHLGLAPAVGLPGPELLEEMRAPVDGATPLGLADGWGLGLARFRAGDVDWFGHDGTFEGTTCHLRFEPRSGVALAVTTNATSGLLLWDHVLTGLRHAGLDVGGFPVPPAATPAADTPDCFGDYRNGDAYYRVARDADGALYMEMDDGLPWRLTCHEDLLFQVQSPVGDEPPVAGRFVPDRTTGEIALMEIGGRVAKRCHGPVEDGWLA